MADQPRAPLTTGACVGRGGLPRGATRVAGGAGGLVSPADEDAPLGGGGGSSLVSNGQNPTDRLWSRQQKRAYHRVKTHLVYWLEQGFQVLWVCLTTAEGGDANRLAYSHQRLRQEIERRRGYRGIQHLAIRTAEGNGTIHLFWAWKPKDGERRRSFYIGQRWLSAEWRRIHGAYVVWVARVRSSRASVRRISRYAVVQYVAGQFKFERMSWSWGRTWGFPLVRAWEQLKSWCWGFKSLAVELWERLLKGELVKLPSGELWLLCDFRELFGGNLKEGGNLFHT